MCFIRPVAPYGIARIVDHNCRGLQWGFFHSLHTLRNTDRFAIRNYKEEEKACGKLGCFR
jgi:hypothetical protein